MKKTIIAILCLLPAMNFTLSAENSVKDTLGVDKAAAMTPAALLRGKVSGVRVSSVDGSSNGALNVNIRGLNTLRGDSQPLWIVDGTVIGYGQNQNLNPFYQTGGTTTEGGNLPDYSGNSLIAPVNNFGWLNPYDIESIEVIKDMSAAAIYGMQGANGVVIITTRKPKVGKRHIDWSSNVSANFPTVSGEAYRNTISHNHSLSLNGATANNTSYNISGFLRRELGTTKGNSGTDAGLAVNFETKSNKTFWFGVNSFLALGKSSSTAGASLIGTPSTTILSRYEDPAAFSTVSGYLSDYDDIVEDYRTVNSAWLRINFLPGFYFKATAGLDYQNSNRTLWYGDKTPFGHQFEGAAAVLNNSLLNYNMRAELQYGHKFGDDSVLKASAGLDIVGYTNRYNTQDGTKFELPYLRGLGMTASGSVNSVHRFNRQNTQDGVWANISYGGKGYGVNGTFRVDWNSKYDKLGAQCFPSINAFADFAKLLMDGGAMSTLKLSAGYGMAGREYSMPLAFMQYWIANVPETEAGADNFYDGLNRLVSREFNAGLDFGFAQDRFTFGVKYYDKTTDDSYSVCNFGKMLDTQWERTANWKVDQYRKSTIVNRGVEIDGDFGIFSGPRFSWTIWGNFAFNHNEVSVLDPLDNSSTEITKGIYTAVNAEGMPVSSILGSPLSIFNREYVDIPALIGNSLPKLNGAIGTTLRFFGFTVDAKFVGVGDFSIVNANKLFEEGRTSILTSDLERGDYFRLERVTASYDIPFKAKWINGMRLSLSGRNLFTATKYSGYNPDVNCYGVSVRGNGIDYGSFPLNRAVVLGVSVNF